jgi:hypothetical protein
MVLHYHPVFYCDFWTPHLSISKLIRVSMFLQKKYSHYEFTFELLIPFCPYKAQFISRQNFIKSSKSGSEMDNKNQVRNF